MLPGRSLQLFQPHRCVFVDTMDDMYFMYWQPGRIITTLAAAAQSNLGVGFADIVRPRY